MTDIAAIMLVIGLAVFFPSIAAALWLTWHFARRAIVFRRAQRLRDRLLECETVSDVDRVIQDIDRMVLHVRIPPEVKV